ncbi:hypothetical protein [Parachitinimonas caeni]|uniref:Uncharacterized protein n=1 Tax=Parachitinimonas caeni TaxID=3031301 RepID=A0ABT7E707_9NEIS|nr:hypothetical protein [Parachitinimonas caeni]MDK2126702.1 hypothetical protein [Parachitinimonas caeni]
MRRLLPALLSLSFATPAFADSLTPVQQVYLPFALGQATTMAERYDVHKIQADNTIPWIWVNPRSVPGQPALNWSTVAPRTTLRQTVLIPPGVSMVTWYVNSYWFTDQFFGSSWDGIPQHYAFRAQNGAVYPPREADGSIADEVNREPRWLLVDAENRDAQAFEFGQFDWQFVVKDRQAYEAWLRKRPWSSLYDGSKGQTCDGVAGSTWTVCHQAPNGTGSSGSGTGTPPDKGGGTPGFKNITTVAGQHGVKRQAESLYKPVGRFSTQDPLMIQAALSIPDGDQGQVADLIAVAAYGEGKYLALSLVDGWKPWNGDLKALPKADLEYLDKVARINVYIGTLPAGEYFVYSGYRLTDKPEQIMTGTPIAVQVQ